MMVALVGAFGAKAEEGPDFRLDFGTDGHMARVGDLAFALYCSELVSAFDVGRDRVVRRLTRLRLADEIEILLGLETPNPHLAARHQMRSVW